MQFFVANMLWILFLEIFRMDKPILFEWLIIVVFAMILKMVAPEDFWKKDEKILNPSSAQSGISDGNLDMDFEDRKSKVILKNSKLKHTTKINTQPVMN